MTKNSTFLISLLATFITCQILHAQTLNPGDIAVLGFNSDENTNLDGDAYQDARWAIVTMRSLTVGTIVHFTDAGIKEDAQFFVNANNEGHLTWTVTTAVPAGKIFTMDCVDGSNFNDLNGATGGNGGLTDYGTVSGHLGGTAISIAVPFSTAGDQIIIYQGTAGTTAGANFIYAYNTQQNSLLTGLGVWQTSGAVTAQQQSYLPTGLTNGSTATALTTNVASTSSGTGSLGSSNYGFDNMIYGGVTTGTRANLLTAIGTPSNHLGSNATPFSLGVGGGFSFSENFIVTDALPLAWGKISGSLQQGTVTLNWETLQEINTNHFEIEMSLGNGTYRSVGHVPAAGNSAGKLNYSYQFNTPDAVVYIRIRQVDIDGRYTYSKELILRDEQQEGFSITGNPVVNEKLLVKTPVRIKNIPFAIFDSRGALLNKGNINASNSGPQAIPVAHLQSGSYYLVIYGNNAIIKLPFVKM